MKKLFLFILSFFTGVCLFAIESSAYVTENLRMRSEPSLQGEVICTIKAGSKVDVLKINTDPETRDYITDEIDGIKSWWIEISTQEGAKDRDGKLLPLETKGWVFGGYIKRITTDEEEYGTKKWAIIKKYNYSDPLECKVYLQYNGEEIFLKTLDENDWTGFYATIYKDALAVTDNGLLVGFHSSPDGRGFEWCPVHCYYIDLKTKKVTYVTTKTTDHNEVGANCYYYKEGNIEYIISFTTSYWYDEEGAYKISASQGEAYVIDKNNAIRKLTDLRFKELYEKYKKNPDDFKRVF
ncbi:MAG: SH3 domain-containing protein [Treponema sp.]|nr:SH3 domain-containing protein [Treponema sp.]